MRGKARIMCPIDRLAPGFVTTAAVLFVCLLGSGLTPSDSARATGTLTSPFPLLRAVSCSSRSLCVGIDDKGHAVVSTNPTAAAPTWRGSEMPGLVDPTAISCASTALCVAVNWHGVAGISTDPTAETPHWSAEPIGAGLHLIDSVSCPAVSLCVAVGGAGDVAISRDPTDATPSWNVSKIASSQLLRSLSCPTISLCVAVDDHGAAVVSTDPSATTPHWNVSALIASAPLSGVSCPSPSLCVAVDERGDTIRSTDPADGKWSALRAGEGATVLSAISCQVYLCVAVAKAPESATVLSMDPVAVAPMWMRATSIGPPGSELAPSVSCVAGLCVAVSGVGAAISANADAPTPIWRASSIDGLPPGSVSLRSPIAALRSAVRFSLSCQAAWAMQSCQGVATLTATERLSASGHAIEVLTRKAKRTRTVALGRVKFTMPASESGQALHTLEIKLNRTGRHLLAHFKRLPIALSISALALELRVPSRLVVVTTARATLKARR
jgi:hypothetical protein